MSNDDKDRLALLHHPRYPRTAGYDPQWILDNEMGPNVLWLTEALCEHMTLEPGMRVLDMGCGRALSSIFLAKEFGVRVWATDLWVSADDNYQRIREAGLEGEICPIRAEAHKLPFAAEFFDAIVCVDSYAYYGTDDLYLEYFSRFVKPEGQLGIVTAGLARDFDGDVPEHLTRPQSNGKVFWDHAGCCCFHTADWWRRHFEKTRLVDVEHAADMEDAIGLWLRHEQARRGGGLTGFPSEAEALARDGGEYLAFPIVVARRRADASYGPCLLDLRLP